MQNTLYILTQNHFPAELSALNSDNGIILINEAVYLLLQPLALKKIFVLESDWIARGGVNLALPDNAELTDYNGFVGLCAKYKQSVTWK